MRISYHHKALPTLKIPGGREGILSTYIFLLKVAG